MILAAAEPLRDFRYAIACWTVICLSILVPLGITIGSIVIALNGKPFGFASSEQPTYRGTVKNGELWHISEPLNAQSFSGAVPEYRLKRLDLSTGNELDTGIVVRDVFFVGVWMNDEYYICTKSTVYKLVENKLEKFGEGWPWNPVMPCAPFVLDGHLTTVVITDKGEFRLSHLIEGTWTDGRRVLFPRSDRSWYLDAESDRYKLLPMTSLAPPTVGFADPPVLTVIQQGEQTHLFIVSSPTFSAYRNGFEFVDEDGQVASALAPENSIHEVTGWERVLGPESPSRYWDGEMVCDQEGPLFSTWGPDDPNGRFVRRHPDGTLETLKNTQVFDNLGGRHLRADPKESRAYLIENNSWWGWGQVTVRRIEGQTVHSPHVILPGFAKDYIGRWRGVLIGLGLAWLAHTIIVIGGTAWITEHGSQRFYAFGNQQVTLASIWRRAAALCIDLLLVMAFVFAFQLVGVEWHWPGDREFSSRLLDLEKYLSGVRVPFGPKELPEVLAFFLKKLLPRFVNRSSYYLMLAWISLSICLAIVVQGRYGITPGKWLCGIRTVGTTLRPCGLARSLVRTVIEWVDFTCLISPLPAAISIMRSPLRKRLGDRVADTIVSVRMAASPSNSRSGQGSE